MRARRIEFAGRFSGSRCRTARWGGGRKPVHDSLLSLLSFQVQDQETASLLPHVVSPRHRIRLAVVSLLSCSQQLLALRAVPLTSRLAYSAWALVEDKFRSISLPPSASIFPLTRAPCLTSPFAKDTLAKLCKFVEEDCLPAQSTFHDQISTDPALRWKSYPAVIEELKAKARGLGLWNLFLSKEHYPDVGVPLTNLEYAVMAEVMGRCEFGRASEHRVWDSELIPLAF